MWASGHAESNLWNVCNDVASLNSNFSSLSEADQCTTVKVRYVCDALVPPEGVYMVLLPAEALPNNEVLQYRVSFVFLFSSFYRKNDILKLSLFVCLSFAGLWLGFGPMFLCGNSVRN